MIDYFQTLHINKFIFVDAENANNPKAFIDFCHKNNYLNLHTQITCFIGANQNQNTWYTNAVKYIQTINKQSSFNLTPIRIPTQGDNALDMVISAYAGLVIGQNNSAEFVIVSNDNDYASVVEHFKSLGIKIHREKIGLDSDENNKTKTSTLDNNENKISEIIQNILKIEKKKRPKSKQAFVNVIKNNHRKTIADKDLNKYADAAINKLVLDKKIAKQGNSFIWKKV